MDQFNTLEGIDVSEVPEHTIFQFIDQFSIGCYWNKETETWKILQVCPYVDQDGNWLHSNKVIKYENVAPGQQLLVMIELLSKQKFIIKSTS